MNEVRLTIKVNVPVEVLFEFTTNPLNTPLWIEGITKEETNEMPIRIGTVYRNKGKDGSWDEYKLIELRDNRVFTLAKSDENYFVRYTYSKLSASASELEYHEWVKTGELADPFSQATLEKLKQVLEAEH